MTGRGKWNLRIYGTRMALFAAAGALLVVLFVLMRRGPEAMKWPLVQGTIQDTRIVADHALETKWGSQMTWKAEYKVAYSVAGREYTVWADSGVRGESEAAVQLALPKSRPNCRVQYNPKSPEIAVPDCR